MPYGSYPRAPPGGLAHCLPSRGSRRRLTTTAARRRRWRANSLTRTSCPALVATAVVRIRTAMHQLMTDAVASYNVLALLNGGALPPPGSNAMESARRCPSRCDASGFRCVAASRTPRSDPRCRVTPGGSIARRDRRRRLALLPAGTRLPTEAGGRRRAQGVGRGRGGDEVVSRDVGRGPRAAVERTNVRGPRAVGTGGEAERRRRRRRRRRCLLLRRTQPQASGSGLGWTSAR